MIRYNFLKAQPTIESKPVESIEIVIGTEVPNSPTLSEADEIYNHQAEKLERLLHDTLPGGTYDRLLSAMLIRRASHFIVSYGQGKE